MYTWGTQKKDTESRRQEAYILVNQRTGKGMRSGREIPQMVRFALVGHHITTYINLQILLELDFHTKKLKTVQFSLSIDSPDNINKRCSPKTVEGTVHIYIQLIQYWYVAGYHCQCIKSPVFSRQTIEFPNLRKRTHL